MPFIQLENGDLEWYWPPQKATPSQCFTQKKIYTVLEHVLKQGEEYTPGEIICIVNESHVGRRLHPRFTGNRAKDMIEKLVKRGKLIKRSDGFYALKPRNNELITQQKG